MSATSPEGTYSLNRNQMQAELSQQAYEWPQTAQPTKAGLSAAGVWAAVGEAAVAFGGSLVQLLREGAPAGESAIKRQML